MSGDGDDGRQWEVRGSGEEEADGGPWGLWEGLWGGTKGRGGEGRERGER